MSVPPGYKFPSPYDSQVPYVCERCGASIVGSAIEKHDAWHAELRSMPEAIIGRVHAARLAEIKRARA